MKNIVIAGAGPVGLYAAIRLKKQYGAEVNVVVIDPYLDSYDRPGIIAQMAVETINKSLSAAGIKPILVPQSGGYPPNSVFIKDLQGALLADAKDLGISLVQGSFTRAEGHDVVVTSKGAGGAVSKSLHCDLLLDCSGERRVVATQVNTAKPGTFTIAPIADNPIKKHFVAYVQMDAENAAKCKLQQAQEIDPLSFAVNMEALRKTHGWEHHALPQVTPASWDLDGGRKRFCFYFEIPDRLQGADPGAQAAYLGALLKLKTGENIAFVVEEGRGRFLPFDVDPKIVRNPVNTTAYSFPIALCGDAHMSPEYRLGTGVRNGIECANELIAMTHPTKDAFAIEKEGYDMYVRRITEPHEKTVAAEYEPKKMALKTTDVLVACNKYCLAYEKAVATANEAAKATITAGLKDLAGIIKQTADEKLTYALAPGRKKNEEVLFTSTLKEAEKLYLAAFEANKRQPEGPERRAQEVRISSNLAKISYQLGEFDKALAWAAEALTSSKTHNVADMIPKVQNVFVQCMASKYNADIAKLQKAGRLDEANAMREDLVGRLLGAYGDAREVDVARSCLTQALAVYKNMESLTALEGKVGICERLIKLESSVSSVSPSGVVDPKSTARMAEYESELAMARGSLVKLKLSLDKAQSKPPGPTPPESGEANHAGMPH
jgi:tetratricopeptide (TPR) repeat protein